MVCVLFTAGLHVPVMPSLEDVGKVTVPPLQTAGTASKVGVAFAFMTTWSVAVLAH